ncbi:MAG: histidine phosphatase family protein [Elusimicrobia bacterium]|nr:histidine phosphatase family protein [Elusimicrobiota bacterium]
MKEVVFMRHGHALSAREAGVPTDSERPLSELGEQEALETARHLSEAGFSPALIISSPFLRASRTAEIAARVFTAAARRTSPALSDGPASAIVELIEDLEKDGGSVLVVGHQPLMGAIAGYFSGRDNFDLSPAGFVRVARGKSPAGPALLEFYSPPQRK